MYRQIQKEAFYTMIGNCDSNCQKKKSFEENKQKFEILCSIKSAKRSFEKLIPFMTFIKYTIIIETTKNDWEIKKRYTDFDNLHNDLIKSNIKNLPKLPSKAIFMSANIIEERKILFEKYLNSLLAREDIYSLDQIFDFIELKKEDFLLMKSEKNSTNFHKNFSFLKADCPHALANYNFQSLKPRDDLNKNKFIYPLLNLNEENENSSIDSYNEINPQEKEDFPKKLVLEFLNQLNSKKNYKDKGMLIEKFKENFFNCRKKVANFCFQNEDIYKLFFGHREDDAEKKGLIFFVGDNIKKNIYGGEKCLELISILLDYEYNNESEKFQNIFLLGKLHQYKQMNLKFHLTSGKPNIFSKCCKIIKVILNGNRDKINNKKINLLQMLENKNLEEKVQNYMLSEEIFDI